VLNHTPGTIQGVVVVYNRFQYRDDREELSGASRDGTGNVVALRGAPAPAPAVADETAQLCRRIEELEAEFVRARVRAVGEDGLPPGMIAKGGSARGLR